MVSGFIEQVQGLISQCRDLENQHNEKMLEIAIITLEKVVKNELDDEIPDDLREVVLAPFIFVHTTPLYIQNYVALVVTIV